MVCILTLVTYKFYYLYYYYLTIVHLKIGKQNNWNTFLEVIGWFFAKCFSSLIGVIGWFFAKCFSSFKILGFCAIFWHFPLDRKTEYT